MQSCEIPHIQENKKFTYKLLKYSKYIFLHMTSIYLKNDTEDHKIHPFKVFN